MQFTSELWDSPAASVDSQHKNGIRGSTGKEILFAQGDGKGAMRGDPIESLIGSTVVRG